MALFFDLLGWQLGREGVKSSPFGPNFNALGIRVSLKHFVDDWVEFANTESPVSEVCGIIKLVVESGELRDKDAIRLRGRLQFANGQLYGRLGTLCFKAITDHACNHKSCKISNRCRFCWPCYVQQNVGRWKAEGHQSGFGFKLVQLY